ncbi:flagellar export chaperone FlgN [Nocardioides sp. InS609-2]|uniref:flagellar export chaperone FlgN n=1 Tax=Nocardioides sp. InS609-2 TaxID=2760705 RepID=UPI0020BF9AE7|nr:flagellar export chaperone FlgN [Nocardioides sp. InS609-2]
MEKLSLILWRERELLDTLLYKLEVERLVLATGSSRWLMHATCEVEDVLTIIRETEVLRAVASDEAAASASLASNPSLRALARAADAPWDELLNEHADAFESLTREITALADSNRELITVGYRSAHETILALGEVVDGYTQEGTAVVASTPPRLFDRAL